jgi:PPM family protein phosphatase
VGLDFFTYSDKGPRTENQDSWDVATTDAGFVACIADGVGGGNCGKLAAVETVQRFIKKNSAGNISELNVVVKSIHEEIKVLQIENRECKGMATTLTACIIKDNALHGVHVGDSRLCILRENGVKQLTDNHTELNTLLKSGKLKAEDAENYPRKHVLESAIGAKDMPTIQLFDFQLLPNDRIILTTDGVHEVISKIEFRDLSVKAETVEEFGQSIIKMLEMRKLTDNVTFLIISV